MTRLRSSVFTASFAIFALVLAPACDKKEEPVEATAEGKDEPSDKQAEADQEGEKAGEAKKPDAHAGHGAAGEAKAEVATVEAGGKAEIEVDAGGYHPAEIQAPPKSKVTLAFTRTTEAGCGQELVIASMDVKKDLPLNETVEIEVEVPESGELGFACGMNMYKGKVVPKA